jgi:hypothetical protein
MKKLGLLFFVLVFSFLMVLPSSLMACTQPDGCTPGYWKQPHHLDSWQCFTPDDSYSTVFGVDPSFGDITLLQALRQGGGGENALGRHAVAALLNACVSQIIEAGGGDFDYCWTTGEVIAAVQQAYVGSKRDIWMLKNSFEYDNEKNCPLN